MRYFVLLLFCFVCFTINAQQHNNFLIGTYTNNGSYGIYTALINTNDKKIVVQDSVAIENPSFLAFTKNKKFVYAVIENGLGKPGKVAAYAYNNKTNKLTYINEVLSGGDHPCHIMVHPSGKALAVANYTGGSFSIININKNGSLSPNNIVTIQHTGSSINSTRQKSAHVHQVIFSKKNNLLYVTDLGIDKVMVYKTQFSNGLLTVQPKPIEQIAITAGAGPRHIVLSKNEDKVFVLNELNGAIDFFKKNKNGTHKLLHSLLVDTISKKPGSAQILISTDDTYLYASNRAEANTIAVIKIVQNKKLQLIQTITTNGIKPRNFVFTPNEKFILVANETSSNIAVYSKQANGTLQLLPYGINITNPVCLAFE